MRFTVHRPPIGEVSPCSHRPSGGDVACSVHVGVAPWRCAGFALEHRLALAVPGSDMPTHRASLRRIRGRNLLDPTTSLVLQPRGEKPPTAAADGPVQPTLLSNPHTGPLDSSPRRADHRGHVECFDPDRVEPARNVRGGLLGPVLAPISLTRLQSCDGQFRTAAPAGATRGPGEPPLQHSQPLRFPASQAGGVKQLTGRQRRRHRYTAVDTDHAAVARTGDRVGDVGECNVPATGPIPSDPVGLDAGGYRPRRAEPYPAHLGHPYPTETAVQPLNVMRFDSDLPESLVYTGFAPRRASVRATEEVASGLREIPQRLLLHGLRTSCQPAVFGAGLGQLGALLVVAGRVASRLPVLLLLDGQVPHVPGVAAMLDQRRRLLGVRKQSVSRHPGKVSATTDTSPKGEAALPPAAEARGFHAATTR